MSPAAASAASDWLSGIRDTRGRCFPRRTRCRRQARRVARVCPSLKPHSPSLFSQHSQKPSPQITCSQHPFISGRKAWDLCAQKPQVHRPAQFLPNEGKQVRKAVRSMQGGSSHASLISTIFIRPPSCDWSCENRRHSNRMKPTNFGPSINHQSRGQQ